MMSQLMWLVLMLRFESSALSQNYSFHWINIRTFENLNGKSCKNLNQNVAVYILSYNRDIPYLIPDIDIISSPSG